jgi:hypothetical protein
MVRPGETTKKPRVNFPLPGRRTALIIDLSATPFFLRGFARGHGLADHFPVVHNPFSWPRLVESIPVLPDSNRTSPTKPTEASDSGAPFTGHNGVCRRSFDC